MSRVYALHRVEPITREGDPGQGLAAPVHDPLWGLARQRQFGELAGEDTGSPVQASLRLRRDALDGWRPAGAEEMLPYDPDRQVLEAVVAGETSGPVTSLRDRVDAGRRLAASLPGTTLADLRGTFALTAPSGAPRLLQRAASAYPDGLAVATAVREGGTDAHLATALGTTTQRVAADRAALEEHATWCATTFGTGPASWIPERLERRFELGSSGRAVASAPAHTREVVDVADLDLTDQAATLRLEDAPEPLPWLRRIPTRLQFPGMPNDRYWEFEDARLALHRIDAATHDLARLALVEFSSTYGNDWFTFPVPVDHGTIATVPEIVIRDTFGEHELIRVGSDPHWSMFTPSAPPGVPPHLLVPSVSVARLAGRVVEEVRLVRDENANLVWGVESIVTDEAGTTHDVVAEYTASTLAPPELPSDAELLYRLMTDVPEHWIPFVPVHLDEDRPDLVHVDQQHRAVALVEAVLPRPDTWGVLVVSDPRSSVLRELRGRPLREEEVGPAGVTVRRRWFLARSADGGRHVWASRSVTTGRGEGASGLAFDVAMDVRGS